MASDPEVIVKKLEIAWELTSKLANRIDDTSNETIKSGVLELFQDAYKVVSEAVDDKDG